MDDFSESSLLIESWILWALGVLIVACRLVARRMKIGNWRLLRVEDYLMCFALVNYTGVVVCINEVAKNGSNYMPPEVAAALTPEGVQRAVFGSIMTFVLEIFTLTATWTIKACLLILYARLTDGTSLRQRWGLTFVAGYCIATYLVVTFMFIFYWCNPTYEYWRVPVKIMQCATYYNHMIFATACNISSDLMLLVIPIPIIIRIRLPRRRKIGLCCVFGLGVFNILAAVLNRYYNFTYPNSYVFLYWYVAEVGVAMFVGNLPLCWPVIRLALGSKGNSSNPSYPTPSYPNSSSRRKPRNPLSLWTKFDEEETMQTTTIPAHDSQVELVDRSSPDLVKQPYNTEAAISCGPLQRYNTGDRIMVVTNVDISSK